MADKLIKLALVGAMLIAIAAFLAACPGAMYLHHTALNQSEPVQTAVKRAQEHPRLTELLGQPITISLLVTRGSDVYWNPGGIGRNTPFPTPSSRTKHINLLTTASGPRGEAYFSVTGTQDVKSGKWKNLQASVYGGDLSERVELLP